MFLIEFYAANSTKCLLIPRFGWQNRKYSWLHQIMDSLIFLFLFF